MSNATPSLNEPLHYARHENVTVQNEEDTVLTVSNAETSNLLHMLPIHTFYSCIGVYLHFVAIGIAIHATVNISQHACIRQHDKEYCTRIPVVFNVMWIFRIFFAFFADRFRLCKRTSKILVLGGWILYHIGMTMLHILSDVPVIEIFILATLALGIADTAAGGYLFFISYCILSLTPSNQIQSNPTNNHQFQSVHHLKTHIL